MADREHPQSPEPLTKPRESGIKKDAQAEQLQQSSPDKTTSSDGSDDEN
jgi:hypothetical protein